ncbi:MAG TPA: hypothetical protein VHY37_07700 [Tepidisphaeraceae bacterium]|nr:hypothetical protein [Tepidisphaeraceae bacterium]
MLELAEAIPFTCPGCPNRLGAQTPGGVRCPRCGWHGEVYTFQPKTTAIESAEFALPDEATCLHHPTKKAVAVCAGSGDYVCALCAVELNGQIYSTSYLDGAGKIVAGKAFDRVIPRPDSRIILYFLLCFVPYINAVVIVFSFLWIPHSIYLYRKLVRVRREDELLRRVVGKGRMILIPILLGIFSLLWIGGVVVGVVALMRG